MDNERKDEQIKKMQEEIKKLKVKVETFGTLPDHMRLQSFESAQDREIQSLRKEIKVLQENSWTRRLENDSIIRNAKSRCDTAERKIKRNEEEHKDFVKKLGEAHASVTSSLLRQVGATELKLTEMLRKYENLEIRATTGMNVRTSTEILLKEEKMRAARLLELLREQTDIVRSLRHDLVDAEMTITNVETRMCSAERIVRNVNGQLREADEKLRVAKEEKSVLEKKLEEVKAISLEMGEMILNQQARDGGDEDGVTVEVTEVDEEQEQEREGERELAFNARVDFMANFV